MSTTEHPRVRAPAATEPFDSWFVERVAAAAVPGGRGPTVVERRAATRGLMAPLYAHDEDETFRVLEGEVTFFVGAEVVRARTGDVVVAPRGLPRTYRIESDGARWLVLTVLSSVSRFDDFGRALAQPVAGWTSAEEAQSLAALAAANGMRLLGPPGTLPADV